MKKILVIAVHPDDETLGCGGTLLKHIAAGDEVHWLVLTKANQSITTIPDIVQKQQAYCEDVAREYAFASWHQFDFLTTELDQYSQRELVGAISQYMHQIKPDILYLNHYSDVHSDHRVAFDAVMACTKTFRYPFVKRVLLFETLSETEFAPAIQGNSFCPNIFNDITSFMEKKLNVMSLFESEIMPEPLPRSLSSIKALGRYRGSRIGVRYAEAFMLIFEKQ